MSEADIALARWDAQREWRYWLTILRRLERRGAAYETLRQVRCWIRNARAACALCRLEMRCNSRN